MAAEDKPMVRASNGVAPQYFDERKQQFEVQTGTNGAGRFVERGRIVKDVFSGSENITKTYASNMYGFAIVNQGTEPLTVTINTFDIEVDAGEPFEDLFDPFQSVTITATGKFKAMVRE